MKKLNSKIFVFCLIFIAAINDLVAQQSKHINVEYQFSNFFGNKINTINTNLIANNYQSIFINYFNNDKNKKVKTEIENDKIYFHSKYINTFYSINLKQNVLKFTGNIEDQNYTIIEDIPKMNWILQNGKTDIKKIDVYTCNKATLTFRGRKFIAWYTTEISIPFGPWKFHGLPGLILEIYDEENIYNWRVTKISNTSTALTNFSVIENFNYKKIPMSQFASLLDKSINSKANLLLGRLPRGIKASEIKTIRASIELKYEWE